MRLTHHIAAVEFFHEKRFGLLGRPGLGVTGRRLDIANHILFDFFNPLRRLEINLHFS